MKILVTGGAGYVGSVSVERLLAAGHAVIVLDSLVTGHRAAVPEGAALAVGSVTSGDAVATLLRRERVDAVLHCAARSLVGQSVEQPDLYYSENVVGGVALLDAMRTAGVDRIVFSSTAAVYGEPRTTPIREDAPLLPINPYGETKRAFEGAMRWYGEAHGLRCIALRYFNVAGASGQRGEHHTPETHLIPNVLRAAIGAGPLTIHGTDYPTADGTCIRDYIHVEDLAEAHLAALVMTGGTGSGERGGSAGSSSREMPGGAGLTVCNLGSGTGFSVLDVLSAAESVVGAPIPHAIGPRRPGDPPVLVASNDRAHELLGWRPRRGTLAEMIGSAWRWRRDHPEGYAD
jgi:UDP-glucose 4-epimerase